MPDERDKVLKKDEEPDVEAHKVLKGSDDGDADDDGPDVEAHRVEKRVEK